MDYDRSDSATQLTLFEALAPCPAQGVPAQQPDYILGHRERLRDRFANGGGSAIPDYELLELLLFRVVRRRDVKPLAFALLKAFGDLNGVLSAPGRKLADVPGIGPEIAQDLKLIELAAHRLTRARVINRNVISSWDALLDHCHSTMSHRETEQFRLLFLDRKNALIADELQAEGTVDHVPVYPREVIKRALELNASALILVHNHPSGDPTPSSADIELTRQIVAACDAVGIVVHDHLIIGKSRETSFKTAGLL